MTYKEMALKLQEVRVDLEQISSQKGTSAEILEEMMSKELSKIIKLLEIMSKESKTV